MLDISTETWNKAGVSVIRIHKNDNVNKTLLLLHCISDINKRWGCTNIYGLIDKDVKGKYKVEKMGELTKQQIRMYKIDRAKLVRGSKQSMYVSQVIAIPIMQTRLSKTETIKFRSDLRFNQINVILKKEQSVVIPLSKAFSAEKIKLQHKILENERIRTDINFSEHKFVVEIDEKGYIDRNQNEENERQTRIELHSNRKFFHRINADVEGFHIFL